ncbi:MAG TPA: glycosyltransferase, partial [Gemmatimonadaceae bacterium]|nr:glycosyltransferase [Gemmatimonadaceae bacterium]
APDRLQVVVALDAVNGRASAADLLAAGDPRVTVVTGDLPGGKAATLNAGVRAATGELLVFTDTHQRFHADAIPRLVDALRDEPRVGIASGALDLGASADAGRPRTLADHYWRYEKWLREREAVVHSAVGVTGAIYVMRRALWAPLPAGLILDDVFTPMRLALEGHRVGFVDAARAVDGRRFAPEQEYQRKVRTLTGVVQLCAWLPAVLVPGRNPIWIQFVFHKLLRLLTPYLALLFALAVAGRVLMAVVALGPALALEALVAAVAAAAVVALAPPLRPLRRRFAGLFRWGVALQAAAVTAAMNGVRGRWDVWRR